ncbi:hypothetical protein Tco_0456377 [Tanacetum coccineum]
MWCTTLSPGYGRSGRVRQLGLLGRVGPTTVGQTIWICDTLEGPLRMPGCLRELGYGIRDTWDDLVGSIPKEIAQPP